MAGELICRCRKRLASGFEVDADLTAPLDGAPITVLYGASAAGKTTLLRLLAGLDKPDAGLIELRGATWFDSARGVCLAPQQRRAGLVFQDYALFPHLTVAENVGFAATREAARAAIESFGLGELAGRRPREISGGQQQRVALARAVAARPVLLLLDEPLSALDAVTRLRLRKDLRGMLAAAGVPSIVVTHDRAEAMALGDWMAVMVSGRIRQMGPVREVFRRPVDREVAETVGMENVLPVEIASRAGGLLSLTVGGAVIESVDGGETGRLLAVIHAEDLTITRTPDGAGSARNRLPGTVTAVEIDGPVARVELDCGFPLTALVTAQSVADLALRTGDRVTTVVKATAVHVIRIGD